jgi:hypothetical protein
MNNFDKTVSKSLSFLDNQYISTALIVLLISYSSLAAPKLPEKVIRIFDYTIVKILVFFLIAFWANKNPTVSILIAVALIVTLQILSKYDYHALMMKVLMKDAKKTEGMQNSIEIHEDNAGSVDIPNEQIKNMNEEINGCDKKANYHNAFYPQYANMKPDAYMARYGGSDVGGYDPTAAYTSI